MLVQVNAERCAGAGQCVWWAPGAFGQSEEEGTVVLLLEDLTAQVREAVLEAAWACPSGAITVAGEDVP